MKELGGVVSLGVFAILLLASHATAQTFTFEFTGDAQTFVIPAGVTLLRVDARGAQGGQGDAGELGLGGKGGRVETTIAVTPGETLSLFVGGAGGNSGGSGASGPGGFNGGGDGGQGISFFSPTGAFFGGGGGGASDIRRGGTSLADRIVVSGGGGGGGIGQCICPGGAGGGTTAADGGDAPGGEGGGGGSQAAGGTGGASTSGGTAGTDGTLGTGGQGGGGSPNGRGGGGGGGGYFGGGGGGGGGDGTATVAFPGAGGGGGSSFSSGTDTIHTLGFQAGNGLIILTVVSPAQLSVELLGQEFCVTQEYLAFDKQNDTFDHLHAGVDFAAIREDCAEHGKRLQLIDGQAVTHPMGGKVTRTDVDKHGKPIDLGGVYLYVADPADPFNADKGATVIYLHLAEIFVSPEQELVGGEVIGSVGRTGVKGDSGPHLHVEVRRGNRPAATGCGKTGCSSFNGSFATEDITIDPVLFFTQ